MRLLLALVLSIVLVDARASQVGDACVADLEVLPAFLLANDAGGRDLAARHGQATLDAALERARVAARQASDDEACLAALRDYLRAWRHGHLSVVARTGPGDRSMPLPTMSDAKAPRFRALSPHTALLTLPSFGDHYAVLIRALVAAHRREIVARANLIIDVRGNGGGSDRSFAPILPLVAANVARTMGAEFLATPDNIVASEAVCTLPAVAKADCLKFMAPVLQAMRAAAPGTFVLPASEQPIELDVPERVLASPRRIGVLIDRGCGSSCEEFVLAVRQSFKVKTFGRPTNGTLDYSNLRPHDLPSGKRRLFYATSRSLRLPSNPIDACGIAPDQLLPPPENDAAFDAEVETVRDVLEDRDLRYRRRR